MYAIATDECDYRTGNKEQEKLIKLFTCCIETGIKPSKIENIRIDWDYSSDKVTLEKLDNHGRVTARVIYYKL